MSGQVAAISAKGRSLHGCRYPLKRIVDLGYEAANGLPWWSAQRLDPAEHLPTRLLRRFAVRVAREAQGTAVENGAA